MSLAYSDSPELPGEDGVPESLFGYTILGSMARGAGSILYYAKSPESPEVLVLKHVAVQTPREKRFYHQLRTEYLLGRRVKHAGLRRAREMHIRRSWRSGVIEAGLILEHCDGYTLEEALPGDVTECVCVLMRAAMAVAALNDFGYVHCDLKPGNIVIGEGAQATVIDLGQACKIGYKKERIQGTPNFMAPEQARRSEMTPQTDVYCFGATMYTVLTGKQMPTLITAGRGENSMMVDDLVAAPHTIDPAVPPDLSLLVMDCVRIKPERRPLDMHEVVLRLRGVGLNAMRRLESGIPTELRIE